MRHRYQKVDPSLSDHVRSVLTLEASTRQDPEPLPFYTRGLPTFLCRFERNSPGKDKPVTFTLYGKHAPDECWETEENETLIAYFFQPFMLPCLFNVSAAVLAKNPLDLMNWNPRLIHALKIQCACAGSISGMLETLDRFLLQLVSENKRNAEIIRYATDRIIEQTGAGMLADVRRKLKLTEKTFQRLFKKYVGISPVQYRRICQFQLSFSQVRSGNFEQLSDVAFDNGFADQSHFIRSFREFTSVTPNHYLRFGLGKKEP